MLMLDLGELKTVFKKRWFWSTDSMSLVRFRQSDRLKSHSHLGDLRERAAAVLAESGVSQPLGSIRLLTQLRYLGFEMNPVCFYYCYAKAAKNSRSLHGSPPVEDPEPQPERIIAIIAEVNNTPWGEQHNYVIRAGENLEQETSRQANIKSPSIDKTFHVSPFLGMNMNYRMAFSIPGEKLGIKIENHLLDRGEDQTAEATEPEASSQSNDRKKILEVAMLMDRIPLTGANLNWMLIKYPLISFKTFAGIYFQALRLYLKKVPFFTHPKNLSSANLSSSDFSEAQHTDPKPASTSAMVGR